MYKQKRLLACALVLAMLLVCAFPMTAAATLNMTLPVSGTPTITLSKGGSASESDLLTQADSQILDLSFELDYSNLNTLVSGVVASGGPAAAMFSDAALISGTFTATVTLDSNITVNTSALPTGGAALQNLISSNLQTIFTIDSITYNAVPNTITGVASLKPGVTGGDLNTAAMITELSAMEFNLPGALTVASTAYDSPYASPAVSPAVTVTSEADWEIRIPPIFGILAPTLVGQLLDITNDSSSSLPYVTSVTTGGTINDPIIRAHMNMNTENQDLYLGGRVVTQYQNAAGGTLSASTTQTLELGAGYSTTPKNISGYTLSATPSNASGTTTAATTTVTYVYTKNPGGGGGGSWTPTATPTPLPLPVQPPKTGGNANTVWLLCLSCGAAMALACTALRKKQEN
jgi:hypothetical protein